jgi:hypothetical protein
MSGARLALERALAWTSRLWKRRTANRFLGELSSERRSLPVLARLARKAGGGGDVLFWEADGKYLFQICCEKLSPEELCAFLVLLLSEYPNLLSKTTSYPRRRLFHLAVEAGAALKAIKLVAQPGIAAMEGGHEYTVLHVACRNRHPVSTIEFLADLDPDSLTAKAEDGALPIHLACSSCRGLPLDLATIECLVNLNPDSLTMKDNKGDLPIHRACQKSPLPLDLATIRLLVDAHPASLEARNSMWHLPLHQACWRFADGWPQVSGVIELMIDRYPDALTWPGGLESSRSTPVEAVIVSLCESDGPSSDHGPSPDQVSFLQQLIRRAPNSIRRLFIEGYVVFGCKHLSLVETLIEAWPVGLLSVVCIERYDIPDDIDILVKRKLRELFLVLHDVLLHDTRGRGAVPKPVRNLFRRCAGVLTDLVEETNTTVSSFDVFKAMRTNVRGADLCFFKRLTLDDFFETDKAFLGFVNGMYRMNRAGRAGGSGSAMQDLRILEAGKDDLSCLFLHLRDCPGLFALAVARVGAEHATP